MDYKEEIIDQMADRLYSQASTLVLSSMFVGSFGSAIIFGAIQYSTGIASGPCFPLVGLVVGGIAGYSLGQSRALALRFQAQQALLMREIERNTRRPSRALPDGREAFDGEQVRRMSPPEDWR